MARVFGSRAVRSRSEGSLRREATRLRHETRDLDAAAGAAAYASKGKSEPEPVSAGSSPDASQRPGSVGAERRAEDRHPVALEDRGDLGSVGRGGPGRGAELL